MKTFQEFLNEQSNKKYELTNETIKVNGKTLYQIKALKSFGKVKAGTLGGYIESEKNLSQIENAWVGDKAKVYGNGWVLTNAKVYDNAEVYGNAMVSGDALVYGDAKVYDKAVVGGDAKVYDKAAVFDKANVYGFAKVFSDGKVYGSAKVYGNTWVGSGELVSS